MPSVKSSKRDTLLRQRTPPAGNVVQAYAINFAVVFVADDDRATLAEEIRLQLGKMVRNLICDAARFQHVRTIVKLAISDDLPVFEVETEFRHRITSF